ncbi:MAG: tRNA threonylcarbamoyladenosine dehydratase [Candidatus Wallbacteria bacterium]|nr:tRNA threonylcarbamoyladenosine dehydratase [Candidatus Wallbacteria bacterium]
MASMDRFDTPGRSAHTVPMNHRMMFNRLELLLGADAMERIFSTRVILFGLGGVGSWCAESLVRSGIMKLTLVDSDRICFTNLNRQLQTHSGNVGKLKANELADRLSLINPQAEINPETRAFTAETAESFNLRKYDYVIDAIDSLKHKVFLLNLCTQLGVRVFSSMGSAARLDPTKIKVAALARTQGCPLAKRVRKALRDSGNDCSFICVYSDEPPISPQQVASCGTGDCSSPPGGEDSWCGQKAVINGTVCHIPAIFGHTLAGLVIQSVILPDRC